DQVGVSAAQLKLGPLQDNGGPTPTMALLLGSPAVDKGKKFGVLTDQRGQPRPYDDPAIPNASGSDGTDIGAYERQAPKVSISDATVTEGANGTTTLANFTVSLSEISSQTVTVDYATTNGTATAPGDYTAKTATLT